MNLQSKINWFKLNGWLSFSEVEPSTVDVSSYNHIGYVEKAVVGEGYYLAYWTASASSSQYQARGDTKNEAVENLYATMGELLWEKIRFMEGYDPPNYL